MFMTLYDFLSDNDLLCKSQFGCKNNSCFTCLSSMVNEWLLQINNENFIGHISPRFQESVLCFTT